MKILFTTPVLEHPPAGGPELRIENSIKALTRLGQVWLVSRLREKRICGPEANNFYSRLVHRFSYSPSARQSENFIIRNLQKFYFRFLRPNFDVDYLLELFD